MSDVANKISKQLDYKVLMDETLSNTLITGRFQNITLEDFFARRIFRNTNIAILFDDRNQIVRISSLGKKGTMVKYDKTSNDSPGYKVQNRLEQEVQPGIKRKDVTFHEANIDPMDHEVQPGIKRRDVVFKEDYTDPMDHELQPGITRREANMAQAIIPDDEQEIQPGIKRKDVIFSQNKTDPMDMEVQPGIQRRNTRGLEKS